jgi:hypothetical protein
MREVEKKHKRVQAQHGMSDDQGEFEEAAKLYAMEVVEVLKNDLAIRWTFTVHRWRHGGERISGGNTQPNMNWKQATR